MIPFSINALGQVTGLAAEDNRAVVYQQDGQLLYYDVLPGDDVSWGYGINDSRQVTGISYVPPGNVTRAWVSEGDDLRDLGSLGGLYTLPYAINNAGTVVGMSTVDETNNPQRAFLWTNSTGMLDLGALPGEQMSSFALRVNSRGQIVGNSGALFGTRHAVLWTDNSIKDLGMLNLSSSARGINEAGDVVGWIQLASGDLHAAAWLAADDYQPRDLGALPGSHVTVASGINNHGEVVGYSHDGPWDYRGFVYELATGEMVSLDDTLPADSGWQVGVINDINDLGYIIGYGFKDRVVKGFVLQPCGVPN